MKQRLLTAAAVLTFLALIASSASAQVGGAISGAVTDVSDAAVPNATVTVTSAGTQVKRSVTANEKGFYSFPNLVPGEYSITASAAGFKTLVRSGITLTVGAEVIADMELAVGNINESIQVTAEAAEVEQSSSSLSYAVNSTTVRELPLNGRDWTMLALEQPGVSTVDQSALSISNQRANRGLGTQLSVGGARPQQNNYRLDGVSINDYSNGGPGSILGAVLGVEAVQEFSVLTSNAPANYGRTAGGVLNAVTRSGSGALHGSAYEFLRNSALDARNFFDGTQIPAFRRNQFGADAGGPIVRNHLFVFGDYEGVRQSLGVTSVNVVPSPNARTGQLVSGQVAVNPAVIPYLALFPLPNGAVTGDTGVFTLPTAAVTNENFVTTRADYTISSRDSMFGTVMVDRGSTISPDAFNSKTVATLSRRAVAVLEETHVFSPAVANSARLGFSRVVSEAPKSLDAINPVAADKSLGFLPGNPVGLINVTGLANYPGGVGAVGEYDFHFNSYQGYDDLYLTRGTHALKFGAAVERLESNELGKANPTGQYIFGSLASFLAGSASAFNAPVGGVISPRAIRQTIAGGYFIDDWRVMENFTLNLGLRYEAATVPSEAQGKLTALPSITSATPHLGSPYFSNPTLRNFEPRVGFAWDPFRSGKTSIRGGFGMFDNLPLPYLFELATILSAPYFENGTVANPAAATFPNGAFRLLTPTTFRYAYNEPNPPRSYVMQWNFNVQRQIAEDTTITVGYSGTRGVHLPYFINDFNMALPTATPQGWVWPSTPGQRQNPAVGQISGQIWGADSNYHSLQVQGTRHLHRGLQAGVSYTWAKSIDTGTSALASDTFTNSAQRLYFDPREGRGPSDFDIRHNLSVNYIWQIPTLKSAPAAASYLINGWQWGGILRAATGSPFTPAIGGDPLGMVNASTFDRPDVLNTPGCEGSKVNSGSPSHYIRTECFAFPFPSTRLGNAGRGILTGPGLLSLDTSLFKTFKATEWVRAQFRAELFNILNRANFAPPVQNLNLFGANGAPVATAGLITSTLTTSRQIQFGVKLLW